MKTLPTFLMLGWFLAAAGPIQAQTATREVDWTSTAVSLTVLNDQILDWHRQFEELASQPVTVDSLTSVLKLHFQKGPIVVQGFRALQDLWYNHASDSEKKSRYLAVSHYFATHSADLGGSWAWDWYRCLSPPLSARYNDLATDAGLPTVSIGPSDEKLLDGRRGAALEQHRLADLAQLGQKQEVLRVAGADLEHIGVLADDVEIAWVHDLGDDRQAGVVTRGGEHAQPFLAQPLERIGRGARLEGAAAHHVAARFLDRAGGEAQD